MVKSKIILILFALAWAQESSAKIEPFDSCELALGQIVSVQVQPPQDPSAPTFLLLPGLHRSPFLSDPAVQHLIQDGAGVITMNFSVQPLSVQKGGGQNIHAVTLESLAKEVETVADQAIARLGLQNIIPVSLSFTGAMSVHLSRFPLIIDTVPLTSAREQAPYLYAYKDMLNQSARVNPVVALYHESLLEGLYRTYWSPHVLSAIQTYSLSPSLYWSMLEGYTKLSQAAAHFEWQKSSPAKEVARVFVLAEKESAALLRHQLEVISKMQTEGYNVATVIIKGAGHILTADQPKIYALVLKAAAKGLLQPGSMTLIRSQTDEIKSVETNNWLLSQQTNEE